MIQVISVADYDHESNILARAHYEVSTRQSIINYMNYINNTESIEYKRICNEYFQYLIAYEIAKLSFEINCIQKIINYKFNGTWTIDFNAKEVTLYE